MRDNIKFDDWFDLSEHHYITREKAKSIHSVIIRTYTSQELKTNEYLVMCLMTPPPARESSIEIALSERLTDLASARLIMVMFITKLQEFLRNGK